MPNSQSIDLVRASSQYLSITDAAQTGLDITGDCTFEAWVNLESLPSTPNSDYIIVGKWGASGQRSYLMWLNNTDDKLHFIYSSNGGSTTTYYTMDSAFVSGDLGTWYHLACVVDVSAASVTFYKNGIASAGTMVGNSATSISNGTSDFTIGNTATGSNYFDGLIDDVRVWNDIRTQAEIQDNMFSELLGTEAGLVGYWKLNGNVLDETSNNNDLTLNNSPVYSVDVGFTENQSVDLERSSSQYLSITDASQKGLDITGDFTLEAWVKFESSTSSMYVMNKGTGTGNQRGYRLWYNSTGPTTWRMAVSSDGTSTNQDTLDSSPFTPVLETWYHVALTWDASTSTATFYVNGQNWGFAIGSETSVYNNTGLFEIGSASGNRWDGEIDEARVWNCVRTPSEISNNFNKELTGKEANLQGYWKLNNNGNDSSPNGNDLTENNSPIFSAQNGFTEERSIDLEDSSSQYLSITDSEQSGGTGTGPLDITGDMTIEFWLNLETVPTGVKYLVGKWNTTGNQRGYILYFNSSDVVFFTSTDGSNSNGDTWSGLTWSSNTWYHISMTYDASINTAELFINGVSQGTKTSIFGSLYNNTSDFEIGANQGVGTIDGLIADVRVWDDIRTAAEIANNMNIRLTGNEANLQGYWQLNRNSNDSSLNGNHLTENNSPLWSTDKGFLEDRSLELASASSQYLSIADADQTGLDLTTSISIEFWFQPQTSTPANMEFVSKLLATGNQRSYRCNYNSGRIGFGMSANGSFGYYRYYTYSFTAFEWYHLAFTKASGTGNVKLYINGTNVTTYSFPITTMYNGTAPFCIGANPAPASYVDGYMDDVRVWSDERTAAEIIDNMDRELTGNESGLVGYWRFNNNGNDFTTNNNNLTESNSPTYSTDVPISEKKSIDFEASNSQYLSIADGSQNGLDITGDLTFEFWWKPESLSSYQYFISKWNTSSQRSYLLAYDNSIAALQFACSSNGTSATNTGSTFAYTFTTGTWYHIALTYDASAGSATCYVNGTSLATATSLPTSIHNGTASFRISSTDSSALYVDGQMDDVRVWNDIRTSSEISDNRDLTLTGTEPNLVGYWKLDGTAEDWTENRNNLTENNSPIYSSEAFDPPTPSGGGDTSEQGAGTFAGGQTSVVLVY